MRGMPLASTVSERRGRRRIANSSRGANRGPSAGCRVLGISCLILAAHDRSISRITRPGNSWNPRHRKPFGLSRLSFNEMHTLLGRVSLLLCALMAAGAASQIAAPGAARSNHLRGSRSSYLQRASIREPVYNSAGEVQESAISSILDESLNATR